jgi:hypothetical protein
VELHHASKPFIKVTHTVSNLKKKKQKPLPGFIFCHRFAKDSTNKTGVNRKNP